MNDPYIDLKWIKTKAQFWDDEVLFFFKTIPL